MRRVLYILVVFSIGLSVLLLSSWEAALSIRVDDISISPFHILPVFIILLYAACYGKISKGSVPLLTIVATTCVVAAASHIVAGSNALWTFYSVLSFTAPILYSIFVMNLGQAYATKIRNLLGSIVFLISAIACVSVFFSYVVADVLNWEREVVRSVTSIGSPIATGAVILLFAPLLFYRALSRHTIKDWVVAVTVLLALASTGSRVIMIVAAGSIVSVFLFSLWSVSGYGRRLINVMAFAGLGIGLFMALGVLEEYHALQRVTTEIGSTTGDELRAVSATRAAAIAAANPVLGATPGHTYPWFQRGYYRDPSDNVFFIRDGYSLIEPHNLYLMFAVEYGLLLAIILFAFLILSLIRAGMEGVRRRRPEDLLIVFGVWCFLLQSLGSSHLIVNIRVAIIFWCVVGVVLTMTLHSGRRSVACDG